MKVVIIKASKSSYWYKDRIGEVYDVHSKFDTFSENYWHRLKNEPIKALYYKDFKPVESFNRNGANESVDCK